MRVGVCEFKLYIPESQSLKSKRQIIKSLIDRLRRQFNVGVNEVNEQDSWQIAMIAVVMVAVDASYVDSTMKKVLAFIKENDGNYKLLDDRSEIFSY